MCRQTNRKVAWQAQSAEVKFLLQSFARQAAAQRDQQIALLCELLLQWRQGLLDLRQRGLLSDNIGLGDVTQLVLPLQQRKHVGLNLDDAARGQIAATRSIIKIETDVLSLLQRQYQLGDVAEADVVAQQAALAQVEQTLPPLQKQLAQQRDLLVALSGSLPSEG